MEHIKIIDYKAEHAYHFERLFTSLQLLQISASFSAEGLTENILQLCKANDCTQRGRVPFWCADR